MPVDFETSSDTAVVEVALSVGFEEFHRLLRYQLDDLRDAKYTGHFTTDEEKAPHKPFIEQPDGDLTALRSATPITNIRRWFGNENGTELVQVQRNWFARNWRAPVDDPSPDASTYPGYPRVRADFADSLEKFIDFVTEADLGEFRPQQCEITYRFQLQAGDVWNGPGEIHRAARIFSGRPGSFLPDLEAMRIITQYAITDDDGNRLGRLYGRVETARSANGLDFLILTMFVRGAPGGDGPAGVYRFLDGAQPLIVNGVRDFLTPEAVTWYNLD